MLKGGERAHRKNVSQINTTTHGFENLSEDHHDKLFGVWRTPGGKHRRIDLIVNSLPEELPFTLLGWTVRRRPLQIKSSAKVEGLASSCSRRAPQPPRDHGL
jgi:hypothetical protein